MADLLAQADQAVQAQIRKTAAAFGTGGRSESEMMTNWKGCRELETLRRLAGDDERMVKQLAIYAVVEPGIEESQVLGALLVMQVAHLKAAVPIRMLAPYLDSENELLRGFVQDWFESHASRAGDGAPRELDGSYKDYLDYISRTLNMNEDVPTAFVEYMYQRSPEQSLFVYLRVDRRDETIARLRAMRESFDARREGRAVPAIPKPQPNEQHREIRLTARIVANAIWFAENGHDARLQAALPEVHELLAKLAAHDQWWVRLYVAEIMRRHRELRQAAVLQMLGDDKNELVREAARLNKPLAAPRIVDARAVGPTSIDVTWEPSVGATSYTVQRRQPDTETEFTTIAQNVVGTTFTDNSGAPHTLYDYRVVAHQKR